MTEVRSDDHPGPQRPAVAFEVMNELLPSWFHTNPPPATGVLLNVTGSDGVTTQWQMTEGLAGAVVPRLHRLRRRILRIESKVYDERRSVA